MDTGAKGTSTPRAAINVTPLIDVLLVLLIIFMVIQPAIQQGLSTDVPQPEKRGAQSTDQPVMLTVRQVGEGAGYAINGRSVAASDLSSLLQSSFRVQANKVVFIDGDARLQFSQIAAVVNIAQAAGAEMIGFVTPQLLAGH